MAQNKQEEDSLDKKLKDAGMWEEGMDLPDKRHLCAIIAASCTSAQHEEKMRHHPQHLIEEQQEEKMRHHPQHLIEEQQEERKPQECDRQEHVEQQSHEKEDVHILQKLEDTEEAQQQEKQLSQQQQHGISSSQEIEEIDSSDDLFSGRPLKIFSSANKQLFGKLSHTLPDVHKKDADENTDSEDILSESLIPSNLDVICCSPSKQSKEQNADKNLSDKQTNDSNPSHNQTSALCPEERSRNKLEEEDLISNNLLCDTSDAKIPLDVSDLDFNINSSVSKVLHSSIVDTKETSMTSLTLVLENSRNTTVDNIDVEEPPEHLTRQDGGSSNSCSESELTAKVIPILKNNSTKTDETDTDLKAEQEKEAPFDIYACLPSMAKVRIYSKRKHVTSFRDSEEFRRASAEAQKDLLSEMLVTLTNDANSAASSKLRPNCSVMWTRIWRRTRDAREEPELTNVGPYALRNRANLRLRATDDCDVDDILPALPCTSYESNNFKKKRKRCLNLKQVNNSNENNKIPQVECQDTDEEDANFAPKKRCTSKVINDDTTKNLLLSKPTTSVTSNTVAFSERRQSNYKSHFDRAVYNSVKGTTNKNNGSNSPVYDITDTTIESNNEAAVLSDNDIMEIDSVPNKGKQLLISNSTPKVARNNNASSVNSCSSRHTMAHQTPLNSRHMAHKLVDIVKNTPSPVLGCSNVRKLDSTNGVSGGSEWLASPKKQRQLIKPGPLKLRALRAAGNSSGQSSSKNCSAGNSTTNNNNVIDDVSPSDTDASDEDIQKQEQVAERSIRIEALEQEHQRQQIQEQQRQAAQAEDQKRLEKRLATEARKQQPPPPSEGKPNVQERDEEQAEFDLLDMETTYECPLCLRRFPLTKIEIHAANCDGSSPKVIGTRQRTQHGSTCYGNGGTADAATSGDDALSGGSAAVGGGGAEVAKKQSNDRPKVLTDSDDDDCVSLAGERGVNAPRCKTPEGEMRCYQCDGTVPRGLDYSDHVYFHCPAKLTFGEAAAAAQAAASRSTAAAAEGYVKHRIPPPHARGRGRTRGRSNYMPVRQSAVEMSKCAEAAERRKRNNMDDNVGSGGNDDDMNKKMESTSDAVEEKSSGDDDEEMEIDSENEQVVVIDGNTEEEIGSSEEEIDGGDGDCYTVPLSPPRNMVPISQQLDSCIDYRAQYSKANLPDTSRRKKATGSRRGRGRRRKRRPTAGVRKNRRGGGGAKSSNEKKYARILAKLKSMK